MREDWNGKQTGGLVWYLNSVLVCCWEEEQRNSENTKKERIRLGIKVAQMSFLCMVAGPSLRDRIRNFVIQDGLGAESLLLQFEWSQLR